MAIAQPKAVPQVNAKDTVLNRIQDNVLRGLRDLGSSTANLQTQLSAIQAPTPTIFRVTDFGVVADSTDGLSGTDNAPAFARLMVKAVATGNAIIDIPAGKYRFDTSTGAGIQVTGSNITIRGAGMGQTIIYYRSKVLVTDPVPTGTAIFTNSWPSTTITNVRISDLTLWDTNTGTALGAGHNPSGIDGVGANHLTIERVEIVNAKGSAAITSAGARSGGHGVSTDLVIRDCWIHHSGSYTEFSGINTGGYTRTTIAGNVIQGTRAAAYAGDGDDDFLAEGNVVDMEDGPSTLAFATLGTRNGIFRGNIVLNLKSGSTVFQFANDDVTIGVYNNVVANNVSYHPTGLNVAFVSWQPMNGTGASGGVGPLTIVGNSHQGYQFVNLASTNIPAITIKGNTVDDAGWNSAGIVTTPAAALTAMLDVADNSMINASTASGAAWFLPSSSTGLKSAMVHFHGNTIDSDRGSLRASTGVTFSGALAAGAVTATFTVSMPGILANEIPDMVPSVLMPTGILIVAWASAADTITFQYVNATAGALTAPVHTMVAYFDRK